MTEQQAVCAHKDDHELLSVCCMAIPFTVADTVTNPPEGRCIKCDGGALFNYYCRRCGELCWSCNPPGVSLNKHICECE